MTITSIFETGFELGDNADELTAAGITAVATTFVKTGARAFNLAGATGAANYYEHTSNISLCKMACHVYHSQSANTVDLLSLRQGTTNIVRVQWDAANSQWVVLCGTTEVDRVTDVPFATNEQYFHIGIDVKIDAAAGWVYVYRDGSEIVSFDGDTNDGGATFNRLVLGGVVATAWTSVARMDDVVWYDSTGEVAPAAIPDYRLYAIEPTGNGNYNEWDGSDGNAVDNYLLVDEIPADDDTTYLTTETADDTESFTMSTFTIPDGFAVEEVIPVAIARKIDALGALGLKLGTRLSTTDNLSATKALGTGYTIYRERQTAKPGGGNWGQADIDGLEVIIEASA